MQEERNRKIKVTVFSSFVIEEDYLEENTSDWTNDDLIQYGLNAVEILGGEKAVMDTYGTETDVVVE